MSQISLRNLRKLDCAGKPVPTFPHPARAMNIGHDIKNNHAGYGHILLKYRLRRR